MAAFLGSDHHELVMDPATVAGDLDRILGDLDAPLADPTTIPTWYMSRLAREKVTVALSGEGADEIFGGYARQRYDVGLDRLGAAGRAAPAHRPAAGREAAVGPAAAPAENDAGARTPAGLGEDLVGG